MRPDPQRTGFECIEARLPQSTGGEIKLTLRSGVGIPAGLDVNTSQSLGLKLVRLLTQQIHGSFELGKSDPGTSAHLHFNLNHYAC